MQYRITETRGNITRRIYWAIDERDARGFANLWNGYAYEDIPDCWCVII